MEKLCPSQQKEDWGAGYGSDHGSLLTNSGLQLRKQNMEGHSEYKLNQIP